MTAGLQIWGSDGALLLDGTHRVARHIGTRILTGGVSESFSDSRLNVSNVYWAYQRDKTFHLSYGYRGIVSPTFSFSGNTLTWTYAPLNNPSYDEYAAGVLIIGAY
jgi:hypothetical protein